MMSVALSRRGPSPARWRTARTAGGTRPPHATRAAVRAASRSSAPASPSAYNSATSTAHRPSSGSWSQSLRQQAAPYSLAFLWLILPPGSEANMDPGCLQPSHSASVIRSPSGCPRQAPAASGSPAEPGAEAGERIGARGPMEGGDRYPVAAAEPDGPLPLRAGPASDAVGQGVRHLFDAGLDRSVRSVEVDQQLAGSAQDGLHLGQRHPGLDPPQVPLRHARPPGQLVRQQERPGHEGEADTQQIDGPRPGTPPSRSRAPPGPDRPPCYPCPAGLSISPPPRARSRGRREETA